MDYNVGDEVEVTIRGVIADMGECGDFALKDKARAYTNFAPDVDECTVKLVGPVEPEFENGLYQDTDGEIILRQNGDWYGYGSEGIRTLSRPMVERLTLVTSLPHGKPW